MKKRFLAMVLTVVMALALVVPGFAAETALWHETYESFSNVSPLVKTYHNGMYGYVNYQGAQVVQEKYTSIGSFSAEGLALAWVGNVVCYVNTQGQEVITLGVCEEAYGFVNGMARYKKDGNWYFSNNTGKVQINLGKNVPVTDFDVLGLAQIKNPAGNIGLINKAGQDVSHFWYKEIRGFVQVTNNLWLAYFLKPDGTQGFLNQYGAVAFTVPSYLEVSDFADGMAKVKNTNLIDNPIGYIDYTGYQAVACQYEYGDDFLGGVARIKRNGLWGYIDKANKYTVQPQYVDLDRGTGLVRASKWKTDATGGQQSIIIDGDGHLVVTTTPTGTNTYKVWGFVNVQNGVEVVPLQYTGARPYSEGLAQVDLFGNVGFVNTVGQVVINCGKYYTAVGDFHDGKAWVVKNDKYGYIGANVGGAQVIPMIFDVDKQQGDIGQTGILGNVLPFGFPNYTNNGYSNFSNGIAAACYGTVKTDNLNRYGIINANGAWVATNQYTWIDSIKYSDMAVLAQYGATRTRILVL